MGMRLGNQTLYNVRELVLFPDADIHHKSRSIKKWLNKIGEEQLRRLPEVKRGDIKAHSLEHMSERLMIIGEVEMVLNEVIASAECFKMKDLAIDGKNLIDMGIPEGKDIGNIIKYLFELVLENNNLNSKEYLMQKRKNTKKKKRELCIKVRKRNLSFIVNNRIKC